MPAPLQIMQSRGGVTSAATARRRPVRLFLSGPAAGVVGAQAVGKTAGIDDVISVAEANAFKPHRATYEMAARRVGVAIDEVLFVANHEFDCVGAKAAGMHTAFIDRRQRPFAQWPYQPDLRLPSIAALADVML